MKNPIRTTSEAEGQFDHRPRKANECFIDAKKFEPPAQLFDEFWREGELALLFGESGAGKSVLAVQIADALARGRPLDGFLMPRSRRKVLYVDLNLTDKQFQVRNTYFCLDRLRPVSYRFSENLYRDRPASTDDLCEWLHNMIVENGFGAIIIDDLSAVKRTHDGTRETLGVMRRLRKLREELDVSILVVTDAESPRDGVSEGDLKRSRVVCTVADSVFAIGRDAEDRYLVQTRSRSAAISWTEKNAPVGRIKMKESALLGFEFDERFAPKIDEETRAVIGQINSLHVAGRSYRAIAAELGISKSQAHRLHAKWTPSMQCAVQTAECGQRYDEPAENEWDEFDEQKEELTTELHGNEPEETDTEPYANEHEEAQCDPNSHHEVRIPRPERRSIYDLTRGFDGYGREIFIESKDERSGKPTVWYQVDKNGNNTRFERSMICVKTERLGASVYL